MRWFHARKPPESDPAEIDEIVTQNVALAESLDEADRQRLLEISATLIDTKTWEAVGDIELTDEVKVTVAANAAIPVLALDLTVYRGVRSIIIRPGAHVSSGRRSGPASGVVSDRPMSVIGQAAPRTGPLSLAWDAALTDSRHPHDGRNVVIHEFAHKIDMSDGYTDGIPPLHGSELTRWTDVLADEYERATSRPSDDALRAYAWTNPAEFFAVATEAFFCTPTTLLPAKPALYRQLAEFYRQDPAGRL